MNRLKIYLKTDVFFSNFFEVATLAHRTSEAYNIFQLQAVVFSKYCLALLLRRRHYFS